MRNLWGQMLKAQKLTRLVTSAAFVFTTFYNTSPVFAFENTLALPQPQAILGFSETYLPATILGLEINPQDPMRFDVLVDMGDKAGASQDFIRSEGDKLIEYFLAALTVRDEDQWVNLSPNEPDRIIEADFGRTRMGRDLLAQDYILKQLTASASTPDSELGKAFWNKVYERYYTQTGQAPDEDTLNNRVWILPDRAKIYEHASGAYILERKLKVMLEDDFKNPSPDPATASSRKIMRDILIPEIEKEVNSGHNFANLRQIYDAMIIAAWFKLRLKESLLGQAYMDRSVTPGVEHGDKDAVKGIYQQYLEAFRGGVYDMIREEYDPTTQQLIPKKYFSGGFDKTSLMVTHGVAPDGLKIVHDSAQLADGLFKKKLINLSVALDRIGVRLTQSLQFSRLRHAFNTKVVVFSLLLLLLTQNLASAFLNYSNYSSNTPEAPTLLAEFSGEQEDFDNFENWTDGDYMFAIADTISPKDIKSLYGSVNGATQKTYAFNLTKVLSYWDEAKQQWNLINAEPWVSEVLYLAYQRQNNLPETGFGTLSKEVNVNEAVKKAVENSVFAKSADDVNAVVAGIPGVQVESFVKTPDGVFKVDSVPAGQLPKVLVDTLQRPFRIGVTNSPIPNGQKREDGVNWKNHMDDLPRLRQTGNHFRSYSALNSHLYMDNWLSGDTTTMRIEIPYYDDTRGNINDQGQFESIGYLNGNSVWEYLDEYIAPLTIEHRKRVTIGMGNEYNYHLEYFGGDFNVFLKALEKFAQEVHKRYPGVQVSTTWGEVPEIVWLQATPSVDVHLMNIYRGNDPTSALRELQQRLNLLQMKRQIGLGEFGEPSLEGEDYQATSDSLMLVRVIEYARQNENFTEATFMTGFDENWKGPAGSKERHYGFYTTDRRGKRVLMVLRPMIQQAKRISRKPSETQPVGTGATGAATSAEWKVEARVIGQDTLVVTADVPEQMLTALRDLDAKIAALKKEVPTPPNAKSGERYKRKYVKLQELILEREGLIEQIEEFVKLQKEIHDRDSIVTDMLNGIDLIGKKTAGISDSTRQANQREAVRGAISSSVSEYEMSIDALARLIKANRHVIERSPEGEDVLKIYVGAGLNYGPANGYTVVSIPVKQLGFLNINIGIDSKLGYAMDALDMTPGLKRLLAKEVWKTSPWMNIVAIPQYMERFMNVRNQIMAEKKHLDFNGGIMQVGRYTPMNVFMRGTGKNATRMIVHPVIVQDSSGRFVRRIMNDYNIWDMPLAKAQRDVVTETLGYLKIKSKGKTVWAPFGDPRANTSILEKSEFPTYEQWGEQEFLFANKAWENKDANIFHYFQRGEPGQMIEVYDNDNQVHLLPAEEFLFGYEMDTRTGESKEYVSLHLYFKAKDAKLNDKFFDYYDLDKTKLTPLLASAGYVRLDGKDAIVSNDFVAFSPEFIAALKAAGYTDEQVEKAESIVRQSREPHAESMQFDPNGRLGYMQPGQIYMLPSQSQIAEAAKRAQIMAGWYNNRPTSGMAINPLTGEVLKVYYEDDLPPMFKDSTVYRKGFMMDPDKKSLADRDLTIGLVNERTGEVEPGIVLFNKNAAALNYFFHTAVDSNDVANIIVLKKDPEKGFYVHSGTTAVKDSVNLDSVQTTPLEYPKEKTRTSKQRQPLVAKVLDDKNREHMMDLPEGMMVVTDPRFVNVENGEIGLMYRVPKKGIPLARVHFPDRTVNLYNLQKIRSLTTYDLKKDEKLYRKFLSGEQQIYVDSIASRAGQAPVAIVIAGLNNDLGQNEVGIIEYGANYESEHREMERLGAWGLYRTEDGRIIYFYNQDDYPIDILREFSPMELVDTLALAIGKLVVDPQQPIQARVQSAMEQIQMDSTLRASISGQLTTILERGHISDPKALQALADRLSQDVKAEKTFRETFADQAFAQRQTGYSKMMQAFGEEDLKLKDQLVVLKFLNQLALADSTTVDSIIQNLHDQGGDATAFGHLVDGYYDITKIMLVDQKDIDSLSVQIDKLMDVLAQGDSIMYNLRPLVNAYDSYFLTNADSTQTPLIDRFNYIDSLVMDLQNKFFGADGQPPTLTEVNTGLTFFNDPDTGFIVQRQRAIVFWQNELAKANSGNINDEAWVQVILKAIEAEQQALDWANNIALPYLLDMQPIADLISQKDAKVIERDAAIAAGNTVLADQLQIEIDNLLLQITNLVNAQNIESRKKTLLQQQWLYLLTARDLLDQAASSFLVNYTNTIMLAPASVLNPATGGLSPADSFWQVTRPGELNGPDGAYAWIQLGLNNPNFSDTLKYWLGRLDANLHREENELAPGMINEIALTRAFYEAINAGVPVPIAIRLLLQQILDNRVLNKEILVERLEILKHLKDLGIDMLSPEAQEGRQNEIDRLKNAFKRAFERYSGVGDPLLRINEGLRDVAEAEAKQAQAKRTLDDLKRKVAESQEAFEEGLMAYTSQVVEYQQAVAQLEHQVVSELDSMYARHEISWAVRSSMLQVFQSLYDEGPALPVVTIAGDEVYLLRDEAAKTIDKAVEKIRVKGFGKIDAKPETLAEMMFGFSKDMKSTTQTPVTALFRKVAVRGVWKDFVEAYAGTSRVYIPGQVQGMPQEKFALLSVEIPKDVLAGWSARLGAGFEDIYQYEETSKKDTIGNDRTEQVLLLVNSIGYSSADGKLTLGISGFFRKNLTDERQRREAGVAVGDPQQVDSEQWMAGGAGVINWNMTDKTSAKLIISTAQSQRAENDTIPAPVDFFTNLQVPGTSPTPVNLVAGNKATVGAFQLRHDFEGGFTVMVAGNFEHQEMTGPLGGVRDPQTKVFGSVGAGYRTSDGRFIVNAEQALGVNRTGAVLAFNGDKVKMRVQAAVQDGHTMGSASVTLGKGFVVQVGQNVHGDLYGRVAMGHQYEDGSQWSVGVTPGHLDQHPLFFSAGGRLLVFTIGTSKNVIELATQRDTLLARQDSLLKEINLTHQRWLNGDKDVSQKDIRKLQGRLSYARNRAKVLSERIERLQKARERQVRKAKEKGWHIFPDANSKELYWMTHPVDSTTMGLFPIYGAKQAIRWEQKFNLPDTLSETRDIINKYQVEYGTNAIKNMLGLIRGDGDGFAISFERDAPIALNPVLFVHNKPIKFMTEQERQEAGVFKDAKGYYLVLADSNGRSIKRYLGKNLKQGSETRLLSPKQIKALLGIDVKYSWIVEASNKMLALMEKGKLGDGLVYDLQKGVRLLTAEDMLAWADFDASNGVIKGVVTGYLDPEKKNPILKWTLADGSVVEFSYAGRQAFKKMTSESYSLALKDGVLFGTADQIRSVVDKYDIYWVEDPDVKNKNYLTMAGRFAPSDLPRVKGKRVVGVAENGDPIKENVSDRVVIGLPEWMEEIMDAFQDERLEITSPDGRAGTLERGKMSARTSKSTSSAKAILQFTPKKGDDIFTGFFATPSAAEGIFKKQSEIQLTPEQIRQQELLKRARERLEGGKDNAQLDSSDPVGGIKMDSSLLNLETTGEGLRKPLINANTNIPVFDGLFHKIIDIRPVTAAQILGKIDPQKYPDGESDLPSDEVAVLEKEG